MRIYKRVLGVALFGVRLSVVKTTENGTDVYDVHFSLAE